MSIYNELKPREREYTSDLVKVTTLKLALARCNKTLKKRKQLVVIVPVALLRGSRCNLL